MGNNRYSIHFSLDVTPIKYLDLSKEIMLEIRLSLQHLGLKLNKIKIKNIIQSWFLIVKVNGVVKVCRVSQGKHMFRQQIALFDSVLMCDRQNEAITLLKHFTIWTCTVDTHSEKP